jgi:ribonuclease D
VARNRLATELDLAPGVLCPNWTLEAVARSNPATLEALGELPELRRWQLRTIGAQLLAAAGGQPVGGSDGPTGGRTGGQTGE